MSTISGNVYKSADNFALEKVNVKAWLQKQNIIPCKAHNFVMHFSLYIYNNNDTYSLADGSPSQSLSHFMHKKRINVVKNTNSGLHVISN